MKTIKCLMIAAIALSGMQVNAQSVDDIIDKNTAAMGGKEKLASLKTVKMTGSMSVQGTDVAMTITKSQLTGARMDLEIMGTSNYQVANDKKGSKYMPIMRMESPQEMEADEYKSFATQMDIQGPLFNYKEKGNAVELLGKDTLDGIETYKLKVTYANGKTTNFFIDTKTDRVIKTTSKTIAQGQEIDVQTKLSDYKQNADGYWFAYTVTTMQGIISFESIETNVKVDEAIFTN